MSWSAREKTIESAVLLAGADITAAVRGQIQLERSTEAICTTGSLPLCAPQLAYYAPGSWAHGPQRIEVWLRARAGGSATWTDWTRLFRGTGELPEDHGYWRTRGVLRLVSDAGRWADEKLCVSVPAFAGFTRAALLQEMIDLTNLGITISGSWPGGRTLTRPQDYSGQTLPQILSRWCELEGGGYRETDAGLELFDLADSWGPGVTPLWDLTRYYSPAFQGPQKPVTKWVFTGTEAKVPVDGDTVTTVGDASLAITVTDGAAVHEVEETNALYIVKGVTNAAEAMLLTRRVTIDRTFVVNAGGKATGQLLSQVTKTEAYYAPMAYDGASPYYTFEDGSFRTIADEVFQEISLVTETYTWDPVTGALMTEEIETKGWTAPMSEPPSVSDVVWPGGESRSVGAEIYGVVSHSKAYEGGVEPGQSASGWAGISSIFSVQSIPVSRARFRVEGSAHTVFPTLIERRSWQRFTLWVESTDGTGCQKWTRTYPGSSATDIYGFTDWVGLGDEVGHDGYVPVETREDVQGGGLPPPPIESDTSPMYALRPWATVFTVTTVHPVNVAPAQELVDAETVEEGERAARYRARIQHAPLVTLYPRADPTRRPWDPVAWTSAARYCAARLGWVHRQAFALDPLAGFFREELQVRLDPFPEVAP